MYVCCIVCCSVCVCLRECMCVSAAGSDVQARQFMHTLRGSHAMAAVPAKCCELGCELAGPWVCLCRAGPCQQSVGCVLKAASPLTSREHDGVHRRGACVCACVCVCVCVVLCARVWPPGLTLTPSRALTATGAAARGGQRQQGGQ